MGVLAPDGARIGLGHEGSEATAAVDVAVGLGHGLVADVQAIFVGIEAVSVFHVELADAYQACPRPRLVTELCLYLVQHQGQVAVALHVGLGHIGDDLFVGGRHYQGTLSPVMQGEQVVAECRPASCLLPQFDWLQDGEA